MAAPPPEDDLTFAPQDLGRAELVRLAEQQARARHSPATFVQPSPLAVALPPLPTPQLAPQGVPATGPGSATSAVQGRPVDEVPWTVRESPTAAMRSVHGWGTRQTDVMMQAAETTLRKLRDEAVQVTWKAAWLGVTSADDRLARKRAT